MLTRRQLLISTAGLPCALAAPRETIIESHVHLFAKNTALFPRHANGPKLTPAPLEEYLAFAKAVGITNTVHVSAEPYQDDLRYLEYTLTHAPPGFLKGTLLLDPTREDTLARMAGYVKRYPKQIVALRIHCTRGREAAPTVSGPIRDRDLMHPNVARAWRKAGELGMAIQAHTQPWFAGQVEKLAREAPETRVLVDHFGHAGTNVAVKKEDGWVLTNGEWGYRDPAEFQSVLRLAKLPQVVLKVSALRYSSREPEPHKDLRPLAKQAFEAFGPRRMMIGSFGHTEAEFKERMVVFDYLFDFLSATDRAQICAGTAREFFGFGG